MPASGAKLCKRCDTVKPLSEFGKNRRRVDGLSFYCRTCMRAKSKAHAEKNRDRLIAERRQAEVDDPERFFGYRLKSQYGITLQQYNDMMQIQGGVCKICHQPEKNGNRLTVDHDHECCPQSKKSCGKCVRGLLCADCNTGLGYFRDNPDLLAAAVAYLEGVRP